MHGNDIVKHWYENHKAAAEITGFRFVDREVRFAFLELDALLDETNVHASTTSLDDIRTGLISQIHSLDIPEYWMDDETSEERWVATWHGALVALREGLGQPSNILNSNLGKFSPHVAVDSQDQPLHANDRIAKPREYTEFPYANQKRAVKFLIQVANQEIYHCADQILCQTVTTRAAQEICIEAGSDAEIAEGLANRADLFAGVTFIKPSQALDELPAKIAYATAGLLCRPDILDAHNQNTLKGDGYEAAMRAFAETLRNAEADHDQPHTSLPEPGM